MWLTKQIALRVFAALLMVGVGGCVPRALPPVSGVALEPGRFLTGFYRAPDFAPEKVTYELTPFTVEQARMVNPAELQALLQAELAQAWEANGLKVTSPQGDCRVSGVVRQVRLKGTRLRFFTGKITAELTVSGAISQQGRTVFAFTDRVAVTSPVNPGPPPPKEQELLLRRAARTFVNHLLTELLLHGSEGAG